MTSKEKATVFFADLRADSKTNLLDKIDSLMLALSLGERFSKGNLVAIKMHFGEKGNTSYVSPVFAARIARNVKETGALTFFTDTSTLYVGSRGNAVSHLKYRRGERLCLLRYRRADHNRRRAYAARRARDVEVNGGDHFETVNIAREIVGARAGLVVLSHFKCHEMTGFGGALKNVGMGCAAREGKLAQHSNCAPNGKPRWL